jgi:hypothetical protein
MLALQIMEKVQKNLPNNLRKFAKVGKQMLYYSLQINISTNSLAHSEIANKQIPQVCKSAKRKSTNLL